MHFFSYKTPDDVLFKNSLYSKKTPGLAVRSIFRRLLRESQDDTFEARLCVKNLKTGKLYYYHCKAFYNPIQKLVAPYKYITIKYEINIIKLNERCF